ncbi:Hypothetical predicted protein [Mytilus galloprovincialis]|uniref:Integrase catalytic domain-containing protein n=1 Tax=Mytilus galloprovincialis TaxID=29158 RepID=A0A8B6DTN8_MYTGA|nr:Hypothetical predicted protein [Mytilus galloprovincialis]
MLITVEVKSPPENHYVIVPKRNSLPLLISNVMGTGPKCILNIVNDTGLHVKIKKGSCLGYAEPVDEILDDNLSTKDTYSIKQVHLPPGNFFDQKDKPLPDHLQDLYDRSITNLKDDQISTLRSLLIEFEDVFSKHDLDLGCLTAVKHRIDTKDSPPVKHRMRRTPLGFQDVEQEYLTKLLAAGVIQPSTSEWSSAPVLVRKRDGSVRWCVDYRALNDRTVKDCFPLPIIEDYCDCYNAGADVENLPCKGCQYCQRAHTQWSRFLNDVDDVIPLAKRQVSPLEVKIVSVEENPNNQSDESVTSSIQGLQASSFNSADSIDHDMTQPNTEEDTIHINWMQSYSPQQLRQLQLQDPDLFPLIEWIESQYDPSDAELRLQSPATRALRLLGSCLKVIDGVLYYKWINQSERKPCLVVPSSLKSDVLLHCHDSKVAGHLGQQKTLDRVKQSFLWYHLHSDCINYVKSCHICNQNKKAHINPRAALSKFHAGCPMERIHLDILGPFNTSESGNRYVLMMIDQFSKWIEMAALPEQSALLIAQKFVVHFIVTFGCPLEVHTDQGRNFDGNLFKALCEILEIAKTRTTPYHLHQMGRSRDITQLCCK